MPVSMAESATPQRQSSGNTPRSSLDASSSAHGHALHFRFRSGSAANQREPPSEPSTKDLRDEAVRSAKRFLLNTIRDDWQFPPQEKQDNITQEPVGYAVRHEGASDAENEHSGHSPDKSSPSKHNPYKFEDPDSVGAGLADQQEQRKRELADEITWNEGLRNWRQQRDVWTNATYQHPAQSTPTYSIAKGLDMRRRNTSGSTDDSSERPLSTSSCGTTCPAEPSSSIESVDIPESLGNGRGPWLPLYPPLLPSDNPVRANIKPAAYDHIYSKVVLQQLTPSLPIPLNHMTSALVEGWKADGAWPPRGSNATTTIADTHKKRTSVMNAIRLRRGHNQRTLQKPHPKIDDNGTVRKSIDSVKKAFGRKEADADYGLVEDGETQDEMLSNVELNKGLLENNK